jgi:hypothetical protein
MKLFVPGAIAASILISAGAAEAATILDFDDLAHNSPSAALLGDEQGRIAYKDFLFDHSFNESPTFLVYGRDDARNADRDGATLGIRWDTYPVVVSRLDGESFDLLSFDFADLGNTGARHSNTFQFNYEDGRAELLTLTTDGQVGLESVSVGKTGLKNFSFAANSREWAQFDNFTFASPSPTGAVPEPGTWAMLIVGFGAVGGAMRRGRRRQTAFAAA